MTKCCYGRCKGRNTPGCFDQEQADKDQQLIEEIRKRKKENEPDHYALHLSWYKTGPKE